MIEQRKVISNPHWLLQWYDTANFFTPNPQRVHMHPIALACGSPCCYTCGRVMFLPRLFVCCTCLQDQWKTYGRIFIKYFCNSSAFGIQTVKLWDDLDQCCQRKIVPKGTEVISWPWPHMTLKVMSPWMSHRPLTSYQVSLRSDEKTFCRFFWQSLKSCDSITRRKFKNQTREILDILV